MRKVKVEDRMRELDHELTRVQKELALIREIRDLPLREYFKHLIAAQEGILPEDVTSEYILKQRQDLIYPTGRYDVHSAYGGYQGSHLAFLTRNEVDELAREVDEEFEKIRAPAA